MIYLIGDMVLTGCASVGAAGLDELEAQICGLPGGGGFSHQLLHAVPRAAQASREAGQERGAAGGPEEFCPQGSLGCYIAARGSAWSEALHSGDRPA